MKKKIIYFTLIAYLVNIILTDFKGIYFTLIFIRRYLNCVQTCDHFYWWNPILKIFFSTHKYAQIFWANKELTRINGDSRVSCASQFRIVVGISAHTSQHTGSSARFPDARVVPSTMQVPVVSLVGARVRRSEFRAVALFWSCLFHSLMGVIYHFTFSSESSIHFIQILDFPSKTHFMSHLMQLYWLLSILGISFFV